MSQSSSSSAEGAAAAAAAAADNNKAKLNTRAEADAARTVGVKHYNEGNIEAALAEQERVLEFFTRTYGDLSAECGVAYLDYAVSLLAAIQAVSADEAMLAGNGGEGDGENGALNPELEEDLESCYENLQLAVVCFKKGLEELEKAAEKEADGSDARKKLDDDVKSLELRLAEAQQTVGDFWMENDDEEQAIEAYGEALALRQEHLGESHRLVLSLRFQIAQAYNDLHIYEKAIEELEATAKLAGETESAKDLLQTVQDALADVKEMQAAGGMEAVRKEAEAMFPSAQEDVDQPFGASGSGMATNNKIYGEVPKEGGSEDSLQLAADVVIPFLPTDASNSMSHFPSQGRNHSNSQAATGKKPVGVDPVNTTVVVRSKKAAAGSGAGGAGTAGAEAKENLSSSSQQKESGSRREREQ